MSQASLPRALDRSFLAKAPGGTGWCAVDPHPPLRIVGQEGGARYAGPAGLVALAAWAEHLHRNGVEVVVDDSVKSRYAWNTGLLTALAGKAPSADEVSEARHWFPLCRTTEALTERLAAQVNLLLAVPNEDTRAALAYMISEMVRNVDEHAFSKGPAFFAAGWFHRRDRLSFAVADCGIGLRGRLAARRIVTDDDSDQVVLGRAMQPHVSGASPRPESGAPGNAGMGLYMTRGIVRRAGGTFYLQSHGARFIEDEDGPRFEATTHFPGTIVEVSIRPQAMPRFAPLFHALLVGSGQSEGGWQIQFGAAPREALVLQPPVDASSFAADKGWYAAHRDALQEELGSGGMAVIDFQRAGYSTQSALHALLFEPLRVLGPGVLPRLWFSDASPQVRMVVRQVVSYALDFHAGFR